MITYVYDENGWLVGVANNDMIRSFTVGIFFLSIYTMFFMDPDLNDQTLLFRFIRISKILYQGIVKTSKICVVASFLG